MTYFLGHEWEIYCIFLLPHLPHNYFRDFEKFYKALTVEEGQQIQIYVDTYGGTVHLFSSVM